MSLHRYLRSIRHSVQLDAHTVKTAILFFSLVIVLLLIATTQFIEQSTYNRPAASDQFAESKEPADAPWSFDQVNFRSAFTLYSGYAGTSDFFGAYALKTIGDQLYVALSDGIPPEGNSGALVLKIRGDLITPLTVANQNNPNITEQGLHSLFVTSDQSQLVVPGTDPCCPDNWDFGNVYTNEVGTSDVYKYRETSGLDHVVHFWGITETPEGLYGAVSSYFAGLGDWGTAGEIFRSSDRGVTWNRVTEYPGNFMANPSGLLSTYRILDIVWFANRLYIHNLREGASGQPMVQFSDNYGKSWNQVDGVVAANYPRMQVFKNWLIGATHNGANLFVIDEQNAVRLIPVTFMGQQQYVANTYQPFASSADHLFVLTGNGRVLKTTNPLSGEWDLLQSFAEQPLAVEYWSANRSVIVSTRGGTGKLYQVDPSQVIVPTITPTPIPAVCLPCTDPRYDHNGDGVVDQIDVQWFISSCLGQPASAACPDFDQNGGLFASGTLICVVNCQGSMQVSPTITPTSIPTVPTAPTNTPSATVVPTSTPTVVVVPTATRVPTATPTISKIKPRDTATPRPTSTTAPAASKE